MSGRRLGWKAVTSQSVSNDDWRMVPSVTTSQPPACSHTLFGSMKLSEPRCTGGTNAAKGRPRSLGILKHGSCIRFLSRVTVVLFFTVSATIFTQASKLADSTHPYNTFGSKSTRLENNSIPNSLGDYTVFCAANSKVITWNSFAVRCKELSVHMRRFAPNIMFEVAKNSRPPNTRFNATLYVKGVPTEKSENYGHLIIDAVDSNIKAKIPHGAHLLLLTEADPRFEAGTTFVIEHICETFHHAELAVHSVREVPKILIMWLVDPYTKTIFEEQYGALNVPGVYHLFRGENTLQSDLDALGLEFNVSSHKTQYGRAGMFANLHRQFDAVLVFAKRDGRIGKSTQRIINAMASGVPTYVENHGLTFSKFIKDFNYPCIFRNRVELLNILEKIQNGRSKKNTQHSDVCILRAAHIVSSFTPQRIVAQYVNMFETIEHLTQAAKVQSL